MCSGAFENVDVQLRVHVRVWMCVCKCMRKSGCVVVQVYLREWTWL
jgi:hypothetical protein